MTNYYVRGGMCGERHLGAVVIFVLDLSGIRQHLVEIDKTRTAKSVEIDKMGVNKLVENVKGTIFAL